MEFRANITLLKSLSDEYFQGRIPYPEYRSKRKYYLDLIDEELNGVSVLHKMDGKENDESTETFVDKALSFLKIDQR